MIPPLPTPAPPSRASIAPNLLAPNLLAPNLLAPNLLVLGLLALPGCAESPLITATTAGIWSLSLASGTYDVGAATLDLAASAGDPSDGQPAEGLLIQITPSMPEMDHTFLDRTFTDQGGGAYTCTLDLSMPGLWHLDGTIALSPADTSSADTGSADTSSADTGSADTGSAADPAPFTLIIEALP